MSEISHMMCRFLITTVYYQCIPVRGPGDPVDAGAVVVEPGHRSAGDTHVQDDDLAGVHSHRRQVVRVLLVPRQPQQRRVLRVLHNTDKYRIND